MEVSQGLSQGWYVVRMVSHEGGLSIEWSVMKIVYHGGQSGFTTREGYENG